MADAPSPFAVGADLAKVYGAAMQCPACGAFAEAIPDPDHRWVCGVCGAPRVRMPPEVALPEESTIALREADGARHKAVGQRLAAWGMAVPAAFSLLLAIVLAPVSLIAGGILVGAGVALAIFASRASRRAGTERKRLRGAVDRAYESAIGALDDGKRTPAEIAAALHIAESDVEAALAIEGRIRVAEPVRIATEAPAEPLAESEAENAAEPIAKKLS